MRILLTGRDGQVGWELARLLAASHEVVATGRTSLDLADLDAIRRAVRDAKPGAIVNAAAYTAVDKAESEPAIAMRVNGEAPGVLAEEAKRLGALLLHYSTDYVFDGEKASAYVESDSPNPLNVYGRTKWEGERRIQASGARHLILRTSWVYGPRGRNFLLSILQAARTRPELRVVDDQRGAPTTSAALARATAGLLSRPGAEGLFHACAAGETTWFGFAQAIVQGAGLATPVVPISSDEYRGAARRPRNSLLDCGKLRATFGVALEDWREGLAEVMTQVST